MASRGGRHHNSYNPRNRQPSPINYHQQNPHGHAPQSPSPRYVQRNQPMPNMLLPPAGCYSAQQPEQQLQSYMYPAHDVRLKGMHMPQIHPSEYPTNITNQHHHVTHTRPPKRNMRNRHDFKHDHHASAGGGGHDANKVKMYCPKCTRIFDLGARTPLLLDCTHTICENCLMDHFSSEGIATECGDCKAKVTLNIKAKSDFNPRDYFPVNYYMAGKLYYNKFPNKNDMGSNLQFARVPSSPTPSTSMNMHGTQQFLENCKSAGCKQEATLRCLDCEEVYCNDCSDKLHKTAKGLMHHRIFSNSIALCVTHAGQPLEFECLTCTGTFCTYCTIEQHKEHEVKHITKLESSDVEKFTNLLDSCKDTLQKLEASHKIVLKKCEKLEPKKIDKNLEKKILKCFNEIHGKLQRIETKLLQEAAFSVNVCLESLRDAERELSQNMAAVRDIIKIGDDIIKQKKLNAGQNIDLVMQRMINAGKLPHSLQPIEKSSLGSNRRNDFEFIDFTTDMESYFKVTKSSGTTYQLVCADGLTDSCNSSIVDDQSETSDISEITIGAEPNKSVKIFSGAQEFSLRRHINSKESLASIDGSVQDIANLCLDGNMMPVSVNFEKNAMENVLVTNIVSPEKFHVQLAKHYRTIQDLHKKYKYLIEKLYVTGVNTPVIGKLYLVKCLNGMSNTWRRGIITDIISNKQEYNVNYIDYGNNATVMLNDIRTITDELARIPPFAFECKLYDITEPSEKPWTEDDATLMAEMLSGGNVTMIMKNIEQSCFEVDLKIYTVTEEFYLRTSLIFLGRAVCNNDDDIETLVITSPSPRNENMIEKEAFYEEQLKKESFFAKITNVVDAITVYIQDLAHDDYMKTLKYSMVDYYNKTDSSGKLYLPRVGAAVAVREAVKEGEAPSWYRGLILEIQQGVGKIRVLLVDTGIESIVSYEDIRLLPKRFQSFAKMATKVELVHVKYQNEIQNQIGMEFLSKLQDTRVKVQVHAHVADLLPEVILFEVYGTYDHCINTQLVEHAGLKSTGFISTHLNWQHDEGLPEDDEPSITSNFLHQSQGDEEDVSDECTGLQLVPVKVVQVTSPECIHVHPIENAEHMKKLTQLDVNFQTYHSKRHFVPRDEWQLNDTCAAYNKKTKQYFRAKIMQRLPDNQYEVMGIDFGNMFVLTSDAMGELSEEYRDIPPMALKVCLYGIKPLGMRWSLMATDYLRDLLVMKTNILITYLESNNKVLLWIRTVKQGLALERTKVITKNVNKLVCKAGLGILCKDWSLPVGSSSESTNNKEDTDSDILPNVHEATDSDDQTEPSLAWLPAKAITDSLFQAVATYVDESGYIYFHDIVDEALLLNLEKGLFEKFQFMRPVLNVNWAVGDMCTVKYHQNQKYYRGIVLEVNETENELRVQMIDYGNVEDCNYNEVWKEVHYKHVPRVAKVLRMHGVNLKGNFPSIILDALHLLVVEKILDVKIINMASNRLPASAMVRQGNVEVNKFVQRELGDTITQIKIVNSEQSTSTASMESDDDVIVEEVIQDNVLPIRGNNAPVLPFSANHNLKSPEPLHYKYVALPTSEFFEVSIICVLGINEVVFELVIPQEDNTKLEDLQSDINARWREQRVMSNIGENQVCIARYDDDNKWYRGKTMKRGDKMFVHFVDFGNFEPVSESEIREIKPEWLDHPVELYAAVLSDFRLLIEDHVLFIDAVKRHLAGYVETSKLATITCRQPLSVKLFDPVTKKLAYDDLIQSHILKPIQ